MYCQLKNYNGCNLDPYEKCLPQIQNHNITFKFFPMLSHSANLPYFLFLKSKLNNQTYDTLIDTGSIYAFIKSPLTCDSQDQHHFYYGGGDLTYCDTLAKKLSFLSGDKSGNWIDIYNFHFGETNSCVGLPCTTGQPKAIMGLSANVSEEVSRQPDTTFNPKLPISIDQLQNYFYNNFRTYFKFLSFRWNNGKDALKNPGHMIISTNIEKYPDVTLALNPNPKSLGYGYTSDIKELHFMVNDKVESKLIHHPHGVFLIQQNKPTRVAQKIQAFFDTGTTVPLLIANGDISLLGNKVSTNISMIKSTGRTFNKFKVIFKNNQSLILTMPKAFKSKIPPFFLSNA